MERLLRAASRVESQRHNPAQKFIQNELDRVSQFLRNKTESRQSDFAQNPDWPGLYFRKTLTMKEVEASLSKPWEDLTDLMIDRYWGQSKTAKQIGEEFNIDGHTVINWLKNVGIRVRNSREVASQLMLTLWEDPVSRQQRKESLLKFWRDPDEKAAILARTQSPEARAKRAASLSEWHQEHPEESRRIFAMNRQIRTDAANALVREKLGSNPRDKLRELLITQRLTYKEVAGMLNVNLSTVFYWAKKFQIRKKGNKGAEYGIHPARRKNSRIVDENRHLVPQLSARLQEILQVLYPETGQALTLEEAGQKVGLSRERVRQLEREGLRILNKLAPSRPNPS